MSGVYPRVCGGTRRPRWRPSTARGLSPRVRGNRLAHRDDAGRQGSIPACAGEPGDDWLRDGETVVYPRVCGGTLYTGAGELVAEGLSPRVRGNPRRMLG